ncbi:MAG: ATP-binding protein [Bacilli bacterium]
MIIRERYLKEIRKFYDQDLIKVIIGIRRCGKSVLMKQIIDELKTKGIDEEHIIYINFEDYDYDIYTDSHKFHDFVKAKIKDNKKYYLFFDEIQNVDKWEKVINSFKATLNVSIFLTGSNSDILSGELATHISGRYVSFKISPFSFKEVCELKNVLDKNKYELLDVFEEYVKWGGLPQVFMQVDDMSKKTYLTDVYNSIIVKDIVTRFNVKDVDLLNRIITYILTTPAKTFSAESLSKYFESISRSVSLETIYNYIDYITRAMLIEKSSRYDIRGKRILTGKYKYYLTDLGFTNILSEGKKEQLGAYLENIVYNELINRGYTVYIGTNDASEVDFIATRFQEKIYIQVAYLLANEETITREFNAFNNIKDNYPKYVISLDNFDFSKDGIIHKNIIEWLLEKDN